MGLSSSFMWQEGSNNTTSNSNLRALIFDKVEREKFGKYNKLPKSNSEKACEKD